jgi:hypothetical protein
MPVRAGIRTPLSLDSAGKESSLDPPPYPNSAAPARLPARRLIFVHRTGAGAI